MFVTGNKGRSLTGERGKVYNALAPRNILRHWVRIVNPCPIWHKLETVALFHLLKLAEVPGFSPETGEWRLAGSPGIAIPARDTRGTTCDPAAKGLAEPKRCHACRWTRRLSINRTPSSVQEGLQDKTET